MGEIAGRIMRLRCAVLTTRTVTLHLITENMNHYRYYYALHILLYFNMGLIVVVVLIISISFDHIVLNRSPLMSGKTPTLLQQGDRAKT